MCNFSTHDELKHCEEKILVQLYGGKNTDSLEALRIRKFKDKVVKSTTCVEILNLPPTLDAAQYHIYRAFYQAKCWMSKNEDYSLKAVDWGWQNYWFGIFEGVNWLVEWFMFSDYLDEYVGD